MQDKIYDMLLDEREITWQSLIYELVKTEQMDPWDIDISLLTHKYMEKIKELEEHNFFISGKVVLAASILLKLKSIKLVDEDIAEFDNLLYQKQEELLGDEEFDSHSSFMKDVPPLLIKTPQARKRKVNLQDLMDALQAALEVETRRTLRKADERVIREVHIPIRRIDISQLMKNLYKRLTDFFQKKPRVTFTELLPSETKEDKILTFIPLLHLENQGKIDLEQEKSFGEIHISEHKEEKEHED